MNRRTVLWRVLLTVLLVSLILAVAGLLVITLRVLLLIFAGVLFGIFLNALSRWPTRYLPISYRWSYAVVVLLLLTLVSAGLYYAGSQIAAQTTELWSELQSASQDLTERVRQHEWARAYLSGNSQGQDSPIDFSSVGPEVLKGVQRAMWAVTGMLVIFFVGLYVAFDPDLYTTGLVKLVPRDRRDGAAEVLSAVHSALGHWMTGQLISMSVIGVLTTIGLWFLGVPLAITLGVVAALLTFIPNIGPVMAAVPQALLALKVGADTAMYVIVFNIALQGVESYLVTPVVQRYEVTLPPVLTIFAQLLMGVLIGVIGVIMAAPLTAAIMVLVQLLYIREQLGDPDPGQLAEGG